MRVLGARLARTGEIINNAKEVVLYVCARPILGVECWRGIGSLWEDGAFGWAERGGVWWSERCGGR